jgi:UDP:flavonoid glycosyltransferase YjiC (YdhE family)
MKPSGREEEAAGPFKAEQRSLRVLYAVSSMGFGHVHRSLPLIRQFLSDGAAVTIVSDGQGLEALRRELAGQSSVDFVALTDYPPLQRGSGLAHHWYFMTDVLSMVRIMRAEGALAARLVAELAPDIIVSDGRFGFLSKHVPSFLICHIIRFFLPPMIRPFQLFCDLANFLILRRFNRVLVPDFANQDACLTGALSHNWVARLLKPAYVGYLASARRRELDQDIDLLFLTGGFLVTPKLAWEAWVHRAAKELGRGRVVSIVGRMERGAAAPLGLEQHDYVFGAARDDFLNRARRIIARSGYTTISDLAELGKDAILIPTPGMTEQAYLAQRYQPLKLAGCTGYSFRYAQLPPAIRAWRTEDSIRRILAEIGLRREY